ncbi:hypothetical protein RN001_005023 [Aquatica leii]|uniref:inositol-1,4-bisphosphate 1-phosphatase n=1 Tax=Aquatica leii TaxID=1421715 RepID=A0AAN7PZC2_9COLE|nr:hypothetical protein RN001_005023 [Aquatica leii]
MSLLESLIIVSEKAANIARLCRQEQHLFELLVQEKTSSESNPRFVKDFKTLADVLIQESVKYDIGLQFPELKNCIKGEEDNIFCNAIGETVIVQIEEDVNATANILKKVLNGDDIAAALLAEEVHRKVSLNDINTTVDFLPKSVDLDYKSLGIWIDPIDSTAEYINAQEVIGVHGIFTSGLRCVTVLIGVYDKVSGVPIIGIINQPFLKIINEQWQGRCLWGLATSTLTVSSVLTQCMQCPTKLICISSSENDDIKEKLKAKDFNLVEAAGAGYKILMVITQQVDGYLLSKNTTFKWDTCGPQAILKSIGGDIIQYDDVLKDISKPLNYASEDSGVNNANKIVQYCNIGGIFVYNEKLICTLVKEALTE